MATGHYASLQERDGELLLCRAADADKDQSYFLFGLRRAWLPRLLFPLQALHKAEVRELGREAGLLNADKREVAGHLLRRQKKLHFVLAEEL